MWHPPIMMKHFTACNIQFPECRRPTVFSCVMTILTSRKACVVMIGTTCPVKIFAQCVWWELFHPITPSVSSMRFLLSSTYMLNFLVFLFFVMISLIGNTIVRVLLYSMDRKPIQFPLIVNYLYMSCGASTKIINGFWRLWSMVSSCWKSTTLFLSVVHIYSSTSDAEAGKAYRWREAPFPCVCWYMYLQTSSQENIVSRSHTLPMSVWYDFHWHHFLRNRCMEPSVVAMQITVPLCCDLYQMHHVGTCDLATGDTVCWS